ncbi:MAG: hydrogenase iron-sulfur subunit [Anaerolineae bacterium]|jgi:coenzyme F420-reducing hydrogenase delta subunit|nr:hydrogenase iron-sulfur subunit [Anaerolineae bacterium]
MTAHTNHPRIVVFACNWEGYHGLEELGRARQGLDAQVRVVRLPCLARLHTGLILKAFQAGADGVLALGCTPDRCHFGVGGEHAQALALQASDLLHLLGIAPTRLAVDSVPEGSATACAERIASFARGLVDGRRA